MTHKSRRLAMSLAVLSSSLFEVERFCLTRVFLRTHLKPRPSPAVMYPRITRAIMPYKMAIIIPEAHTHKYSDIIRAGSLSLTIQHPKYGYSSAVKLLSIHSAVIGENRGVDSQNPVSP